MCEALPPTLTAVLGGCFRGLHGGWGWRFLGLAICIFEGLGTADVQMHGFKVPKSAYIDDLGLPTYHFGTRLAA